MTPSVPKGRPPALFPLFAAIDTAPGIGEKMARAFATLGVTRLRDMLFLLPHAVIDRRPVASIREVVPPAVVSVWVTVLRHIAPTRRGGPSRVVVRDAATEFQLVFFHARGNWLTQHLPVGARRLVSGKVELFDGMAQIVHPDHLLAEDEAADLRRFEPVYPLAAGLGQRVMAKTAATALDRAPDLAEWIDPGLMQREGWPGWHQAVAMAHAPVGLADVSPQAPARARLAYDEMFAHQLTLAIARRDKRRGKGRATRGDGRLRAAALAALPFAPTAAQHRAMDEIVTDMASDLRMNRLLQGDVGAGKTLVAWIAALAAIEAGGQAVLMAPTEILARQHFESLRPLAEAVGVRAEILTGRDKGADRAAKLGDLAVGQIHLLIGTHAVFQPDVQFADLRLAIIDEQHRFGVAQRMELGRKGDRPDVLVMTATPIPRSLALAQYGDMDVSLIDEKPPGRSPVTTALIAMDRIEEVIAHLSQALAEGRQAYWVCPLVEDSELTDLTAAETRFQQLRARLDPQGQGLVALVHGQMVSAEKDAAMAAFVSGAARVLVATTVIEVGVNVPNASIMVIERADSFGLAQLHQLRGRVGRGAARSSCLMLFQSPLSETASRRLSILRETEDGFRIAEEDLAMRGAGDLIGTAQAGLPRFRIADLERQAGLMAIAQSDSRKLLADDPRLESPRGQAARGVLWLMEQDQGIRLLSIG